MSFKDMPKMYTSAASFVSIFASMLVAYRLPTDGGNLSGFIIPVVVAVVAVTFGAAYLLWRLSSHRRGEV